MTNHEITFRAHGMHCHGCEHVIEASLRKLPGVQEARADYPTETIKVEYDAALVGFDVIRARVEEKGYRVEKGARRAQTVSQRAALAAAALAGLAALILIDTRWISAAGAPDIAQHMSLWLIFTLGLVTGFHCIGMCGAFVVGYGAADAQAGRAALPSHLAYGAGKTLSYTVIGALFGALGAVIAFTPLLRGAVGIGAGLFLVMFGLNMLGLFAPLRRFRLGLPAPLARFVQKEAGGRHQPFVIGLLNGLMIACGPLQAMYVMAAGTGSPTEGAKMLFAFGLGTLPVMLAFGAIASILSSALTHRLLKASGVIVVALGAVMVNRGLILTGWGCDLASIVAQMRPDAPPAPREASATQTIKMEANALGYAPSRFTLIKGLPVRWEINATQVTECNKRIVAPALDLAFDLKPGLQVVEFTPKQAGIIPWSCWMGMMRGQFDVVDSGAVEKEEEKPAPEKPAPPREEAAPAKPTTLVPGPAETYAARGGETLKSLARKLYGDAGRWRDIAAANPGLRKGRLVRGQVLQLPPRAKP